jgi:hypothetical protein
MIVAAVVLFFVLRERADRQLEDVSGIELSGVNSMIQDCINERFLDGVRLVGFYGGYISPANYVPEKYPPVAYGYDTGRNVLALKETIEKEIAGYIETSLPLCFNIDSFPEFNISLASPIAEIEIADDFVSASVVFPINIEKENKSATIDKAYTSRLPVRLGMMHDVANDIVEKEIQNPDEISISDLLEYPFYVRVITYDDNFIVYSITDTEFTIKGVPYTFRFSNKFA